MTRSLGVDLRWRVIEAVEEGVSAREAARRFKVGISTAIKWHRRYRETGECLAEGHDIHVVPSTIWYFLDKRGVTFKKRQRTPPSNSAPMS